MIKRCCPQLSSSSPSPKSHYIIGISSCIPWFSTDLRIRKSFTVLSKLKRLQYTCKSRLYLPFVRIFPISPFRLISLLSSFGVGETEDSGGVIKEKRKINAFFLLPLRSLLPSSLFQPHPHLAPSIHLWRFWEKRPENLISI